MYSVTQKFKHVHQETHEMFIAALFVLVKKLETMPVFMKSKMDKHSHSILR